MSLVNRYTVIGTLLASSLGAGYLVYNQEQPVVLQVGQIYNCSTQGSTGYIRPTDDSTKVEFYLDNHNLLVRPQMAQLITDRSATYLIVEGGDRVECQLTPYSDYEPVQVPDGNNFTQPLYQVHVTSDVPYALGRGFWSTYPEDFRPFLTIYSDKLGDVFSGMNPLELTMDIYEPDDGRHRRRPLAVMVHGGAFYNGDKGDEEYVSWCRQLASYGYTAVSVNYRMGFLPLKEEIERAAYRAVQDVHAAVRFMLSHADKYLVDPDRVYLAGCSAGAITALHVASMGEATRPASTYSYVFHSDMGPVDDVPVTPAYDQPVRIRAICSMWGAVFSADSLTLDHTSLLSIHDSLDPVVPYAHGIPFANAFGPKSEAARQQKPTSIWGWIKSSVKQSMEDMRKNFTQYMAQATFPPVDGSQNIETRLRTINPHTRHQLYTTNLARHTIIRDPETNAIDPERMDWCTGLMMNFFRDVMLDRQVSLEQDPSDHSIFYLSNADDIEICSWQVEGGIITAKQSDTRLRLLFFNDDTSNRIAISVRGIYRNGIPFHLTRVFREGSSAQ